MGRVNKLTSAAIGRAVATRVLRASGMGALVISAGALGCGTSSKESPTRVTDNTAGPACVAAPVMAGDSATGTEQKVTVSSGDATLMQTTKLNFDKSWEKTQRITQRGRVVVAFDLRGASDGSIEGQMDVDPSFSGSIHRLSVSGRVHEELRLAMDGKAVRSIPWATLEQNPALLSPGGFADGSPLPAFASQAQELLEDLTKKAANAAAHCTASPQIADGPGVKPLSTPPNHGSFPGDNPPDPAGCKSCRQECFVQFNSKFDDHGNLVGCLIQDSQACYEAAIAAGIGCTAVLGPFGGFVCGAVVGTACEIYMVSTDCIPGVNNCIESCKHTPACCGNPCGDVCCGSDTCVAPDTCCPAGNQYCQGTQKSSCYDPSKETCLPTGEGCPVGSACNNNTLCCGGLSQCIHPVGAPEFCCDALHSACGTALCCDYGTCAGDGKAHPFQCCDSPDQTCGNKCCPQGQRCVGDQCITENVDCSCHTSPCVGQYACQSTGYPTVCCFQAQDCASGQCCPLGQHNCQGKCTSQACVK